MFNTLSLPLPLALALALTLNLALALALALTLSLTLARYAAYAETVWAEATPLIEREVREAMYALPGGRAGRVTDQAVQKRLKPRLKVLRGGPGLGLGDPVPLPLPLPLAQPDPNPNPSPTRTASEGAA